MPLECVSQQQRQLNVTKKHHSAVFIVNFFLVFSFIQLKLSKDFLLSYVSTPGNNPASYVQSQLGETRLNVTKCSQVFWLTLTGLKITNHLKYKLSRE